MCKGRGNAEVPDGPQARRAATGPHGRAAARRREQDGREAARRERDDDGQQPARMPGRRRSTITSSRGPGSWRSGRPSRWRTSATSRRAYSPGVAEACLEIKADPQSRRALHRARATSSRWSRTARRCSGLGNIGALAGKPVMEGKAVLFKKFANIDCFDIEVNESDPVKLAEIVASLEPTFGAINLEDIKAPECFVVERLCRERMKIPVFHDDQHGTAIVVGAAAINALRVAKKKIEDDQDRLDRRRRRRHRLPQHADQARGEAREHLALRPARAWSTRAAATTWARRRRPSPRRPTRRTVGGRDPGRRPLPRPLRAGRADRRDGEADGARTRSSSRSPTRTRRSGPRRRARPTRT